MCAMKNNQNNICSYKESGYTDKANEAADKAASKVEKSKEKKYSSLEEEIADIEEEAMCVKEQVFPYTWEKTEERWKAKFNDLYNDLEKIYREDEKIQCAYKLYINKSSDRTYWNNEILSKYVFVTGGVCENTLDNWRSGRILPGPNSRDAIIQLGFLAYYDREQINELLNCAGLSELYIKGTRINKAVGSNLNDFIYCKMIREKYPFGRESFNVATDCIAKINDIVGKKVKSLRKEQKNNVAESIYKKSTKDMWNDAYNQNDVTEAEQVQISPDERAWGAEVEKYVNENVEAFVFSYTSFFGDITEAFEEQYGTVKRGDIKNDEQDEESEVLYIKGLVKSWGKEFYEILCTAFNTSNNIIKDKMVMPSREDVIILALVLDCDYRKMEEYLQGSSMPELHNSNRVECIIRYALKNNKKVSPKLAIRCVFEHNEKVSTELMFSRFEKALMIASMDRNKKKQFY